MRGSLDKWVTGILYRGCTDLDDPEARRQAALHNVVAVTGQVVASGFGLAAIIQGRFLLAAAVLGAAVLMAFTTLMRYHTRFRNLGGLLGVSTAGVLFLYLLARGGGGGTGYLWLPIFPLFAVLILERWLGLVISAVYLALAAVILFVPGLPWVAMAYETPLAARLMGASIFAAAIAVYNEFTRSAAHARLRAEIEVRRQAEAEVTRVSQAKSDLLAAVSHEVRTPLTALMGLNDLLRQTRIDDQQRTYLELAARSGRSLSAIVNDLLDLSRVEAGKLHLESVRFDLHEVVRALVEMHRVLATGRPITVDLDWASEVPRAMLGDPARVRQVLSNLVGNAVKFTSDGWVLVRVRMSGEEVEVTVRTRAPA